MSGLRRALVAMALAGALAGCGDGEELLSEDSLRGCLASQGLGANPQGDASGGGPPLYLSTAPDFSAYASDGTRLDVVVQGSEEKAHRTAADVRGAMLPLGISDAEERVVASRNAVAVFTDTPSAKERDAAASCLR